MDKITAEKAEELIGFANKGFESVVFDPGRYLYVRKDGVKVGCYLGAILVGKFGGFDGAYRVFYDVDNFHMLGYQIAAELIGIPEELALGISIESHSGDIEKVGGFILERAV